MQVLAGHLAHASSVVRGGRTFSRRVINLAKYMQDKSDWCSLPSWFLLDLEWWESFCGCFNGKAKIIVNDPEFEIPVETDASMTGFGARCGSFWFLGVWHLPNPPIGIPPTLHEI